MHVLQNKNVTATTIHEFILLGFLCSQEAEILLFCFILHHLHLGVVGQQCYYLCCVVGPATPHPHVYLIGQPLFPGDLLHQFQCAQHVIQLPIQDQDHLL